MRELPGGRAAHDPPPLLPLMAPLPGISDLHAFSADVNCGELGSMPLGRVKICPPPDPQMVLAELGSGKLGTPWERMHLAKFSSSPSTCCSWAVVRPALACGCGYM